ncbi:putative clathrin assembly protein At2g01600 isoform X1 [Triticum dicoccoides]|uniref:putative clathrin assembly protein At2g01600 isoform X1 n=1 Tax=Triticum dicoccoides TaxID=85692 RepID=UPI0018911B4D|nr:putative clathrin assembly protein At2g01600 isoform X1 [Triticum dicoccoides]
MGSGTWRKAYGALKDSTKVGLANFNIEYKDLDITIVKTTNHVECPPKERHFRRIVFANSANRPRADVAYSICALARMSKTKSWIVGSLFVYLGSSSLSVYLCRLIILDSIIYTRYNTGNFTPSRLLNPEAINL